jgi:hypothetical protein
MDQDHGWVAKDAASAPRVAIAEFVFMAVRSRFFGIAK